MSTTRMLVLALVRWLEPVHGYEVRRELVSWNVEEWANILSDWPRVKALFPFAETKETFGPSGGTEPLVILRKPL